MDNSEARIWLSLAQSGDTDARNTLAEAFLPACRQMAGAFAKHAERAGVSVESEEMYAVGYMHLLESIIPRYSLATDTPFHKWVNLKLRGRLSNYLRREGKRQGREVIMDLSEVVDPDDVYSEVAQEDGPPIDTETDKQYPNREPAIINHHYMDHEVPGDLMRLLDVALMGKVITGKQHGILSLIGEGETIEKAGAVYGLKPRRSYQTVKDAKKAIRREVLEIAD